MKRKDVINYFKVLRVSASTVDRTMRKLKNCGDKSCLLLKAGSSGENKKLILRQPSVQLEKESTHQAEKSQEKFRYPQ